MKEDHMSLELYFHPFSSFCQKALVALYENDTPFEPIVIDLGDPASAARPKRTWAIGDRFSMADCAAAPALYYANLVKPLGDAHGNAAAYLKRLMERPSFARAVKEAEPYRKLFPL